MTGRRDTTRLRGTELEAKLRKLYRVPEDGKAEIVDGELVLMSTTGFLPGYAGGEIFASLREYARRTGRGYALPDNVGFLVDLPGRRSFSPNAAFYVGEPTGGRFLDGAPIFAVEVRSEGDYGGAVEAALERKRADYFAAGTARSMGRAQGSGSARLPGGLSRPGDDVRSRRGGRSRAGGSRMDDGSG